MFFVGFKVPRKQVYFDYDIHNEKIVQITPEETWIEGRRVKEIGGYCLKIDCRSAAERTSYVTGIDIIKS
jgi:hypothetical protein